MAEGCFGEYDLEKLKEARDLLMVVLNYHYGSAGTRRMWRRLDTIVIKLNKLIEDCIINGFGLSDGVLYEEDLSKASEENVKESLDEVARRIVGAKDSDILKSETLKGTEQLGWAYKEDESGIEFSHASPAGENFSFYVKTGRISVISNAVEDYYQGFDPDEHALLVYKMAGAPSLRALIADADYIDSMLEELSRYLHHTVEAWCEEYGVDDRTV